MFIVWISYTNPLDTLSRLMAMEKLVDFFIIGVQKGGTTALCNFLRQHSKIQMSRDKEPHHFDNEQLNWSAPNHDGLHTQFDWTINDVIRGEATPIYVYWPHSLPRLHRYNPHVKLIVGLRHPTFRAYSHWRMEVGRNAETLKFNQAISSSGRRRVSGAQHGVHRIYSYVERGFYAGQIRTLFDLFPRRNVHFFRTDKLWIGPSATLAAIERFLGIDADTSLRAKQHYIVPTQSAKTGDMSQEVREQLNKTYWSDIQITAELTGLDLTDWLSANYREPMSQT